MLEIRRVVLASGKGLGSCPPTFSETVDGPLGMGAQLACGLIIG